MASLRSTQKSSLQLFYVPLFYWSFPYTFLYFGLPIYGKALGANATAIGGLFSAFTLATLLLRPIVSSALDRYRRKAFLLTGFVLYTLAMGTFAMAKTLPGLYLARVIQGLGSAFLWVTVYTMITDLTGPQDRGQALGRLDETIARGGLLGIFAGIFILTIFPDKLGWQLSFLAFTALMGVGAFLVIRLVPETKPDPPPPARVRLPASRKHLPLLLVVFLTGASGAMLAPIYLIFLQDRFTTDIPLLALAFLPGGLITAFLATQLGSLSDRFGRVPILTLGLLTAGAFSLLLPGTPSLVWLVILYTLATVAWHISKPAEAELVSALTGRAARGRDFGSYEMAGLSGAALGPLIGGLLYDAINPAAPFYLNGAILLGGVAWVALVLRAKEEIKT